MLTRRAAELNGTVRDGGSRPVSDYVVVAFSSDSSRWGYGSRFGPVARPNQDGRFSLQGLAAGWSG